MKIFILLAAVVGLSSAFLTTRLGDDIRDVGLVDRLTMVKKYDVDFDIDKHDMDKILLVHYLVKGRCFTLDHEMVRCDKDLITRLLDDIWTKRYCVVVGDDVLRCDKDLIRKIKVLFDTGYTVFGDFGRTIGKTWRDLKTSIFIDVDFYKLLLTKYLVNKDCVILDDGLIRCDRDLVNVVFTDHIVKDYCTVVGVDRLRCDMLLVKKLWTYILKHFDVDVRMRHMTYDTIIGNDFDKLLLTDYLVKGRCMILVDGRIRCDTDLINTLFHDFHIKKYCTIDGVDVLRCDLDWINRLKLYIFDVFGLIVDVGKTTYGLDKLWKYKTVMGDDLVRDRFVHDKMRTFIGDDFDKLLLTDYLVKGRCMILVDGRIRCDKDLITTLFTDYHIKKYCTIDGVDVLHCDLDFINRLKLYIFDVFGLIVDVGKTFGKTYWKDRIVRDDDVMFRKYDTKFHHVMDDDLVRDRFVKHDYDLGYKKDFVTKYDTDYLMKDKYRGLTDDLWMGRTWNKKYIY